MSKHQEHRKQKTRSVHRPWSDFSPGHSVTYLNLLTLGLNLLEIHFFSGHFAAKAEPITRLLPHVILGLSMGWLHGDGTCGFAAPMPRCTTVHTRPLLVSWCPGTAAGPRAGRQSVVGNKHCPLDLHQGRHRSLGRFVYLLQYVSSRWQ